MQKNVIIAIALSAILAVAAVGVAYAYTATTTNTENTLTTQYLKVTMDKDTAGTASYSGDFSKALVWDTETGMVEDNETTYWTLASESPVTELLDATTLDSTLTNKGAVLLGTVYLNVTDEDDDDTQYTMTVSHAQALTGSFCMQVGTGATAEAAGTAATNYVVMTSAAEATDSIITTATTNPWVCVKIYGLYDGYNVETGLSQEPENAYSNAGFVFKAQSAA